MAATSAEEGGPSTLVLVQRGTTPRQRHFVRDVLPLLPGAWLGPKMGEDLSSAAVRRVARGDETTVLALAPSGFEDDMIAWVACMPHGPSAAFRLVNVHTVAELNLGRKPKRSTRTSLAIFSSDFDDRPHLRLIKELLLGVFGDPRTASNQPVRSVLSFMHSRDQNLSTDMIWLRAFDLGLASTLADGEESVHVDERGPRMVLCPLCVRASVFTGPLLWAPPGSPSPPSIPSPDAVLSQGGPERTASRRARPLPAGVRSEPPPRKRPKRRRR